MVRTQVYLTELERKELALLSKATGKKQSELIRQAVDDFFAGSVAKRRDAVLQRAAGMWKDRDDLPDFASVRAEWDRG